MISTLKSLNLAIQYFHKLLCCKNYLIRHKIIKILWLHLTQSGRTKKNKLQILVVLLLHHQTVNTQEYSTYTKGVIPIFNKIWTHYHRYLGDDRLEIEISVSMSDSPKPSSRFDKFETKIQYRQNQPKGKFTIMKLEVFRKNYN